MRRKTYIALHKSEWDRLHRRTDDRNQVSDQRDAYFQKLVEISQSWIKTWPDTVQGHVEQLKKEKKKHQQEEIALVKAFLEKKKTEGTTDAITKAKQLIFEGSCYGKQLTSALLESKTLEERELQIEYQKELKQKAQDEEKEALSKLNRNLCSFELDKRADDNKRKKKEMEIELAKINQSIYEMEISKKNKEKKEQEKLDRENARLMQELLDSEARWEKEYENHLRRDIDLYERKQKIARERKIEREKKEEEIVKAQRKELDRKHCAIRRAMKNMHQDRQNSDRYKRNYELIKEIQEKEEKRYKDFVQKAIKKLEVRFASSTQPRKMEQSFRWIKHIGAIVLLDQEKDQEETLKQKSEHHKRIMISKHNKAEAENVEHCRVAWKQYRCFIGDRQCFLPKSCHKRQQCSYRAIEEKQPTTFLMPAKKFLEQLEARKKMATPWSGLQATHAQFAKQATSALQEARHKRFVKKVIDDYRKTNYLDATTLSVPGYN